MKEDKLLEWSAARAEEQAQVYTGCSVLTLDAVS